MKAENAKTYNVRDLKYQQGQSGPCVASTKGLALQQEDTAAEQTGCKVKVHPGSHWLQMGQPPKSPMLGQAFCLTCQETWRISGKEVLLQKGNKSKKTSDWAELGQKQKTETLAASYCCPRANATDSVRMKQDLEYFTFIVSFIPRLTFIRKVYYSDT